MEKSSLGGYPLGAENDSAAPYNEHSHTCERCHGEGEIYFKFDRRKDDYIEVTWKEWNSLPDESEEVRFCKGEECRCPDCDGDGVIYL
ncbi:MAG: hypothetical protein WCS17_01820 [Prevotella sp.]